MKTIITTFAIAALALFGAAPEAQARPHNQPRVFISGYRSCGTPIYSERYFIGYDRCGNPVWGVRQIRQEYRQEYRPVVRDRYVPQCPQPYYPGPGRYSSYDGERPNYGGGLVIQGYFGR